MIVHSGIFVSNSKSYRFLFISYFKHSNSSDPTEISTVFQLLYRWNPPISSNENVLMVRTNARSVQTKVFLNGSVSRPFFK